MLGAASLPQCKPAVDRVMVWDGIWQGGMVEALPPGGIFTGASNGTVWQGVDLLAVAGTDVARCGVNPLTGGARGVLIENAGTNFARVNRELTNAWWGKAAASVTASAVLSMDGSTTMFKLVENNATAEHEFYRDLTVTAGHYFAVGVDVKAAERGAVYITLRNAGNTHACTVVFDLAAETMTTTLVGSGVLRDRMLVKVSASGVYRCTLVGRINATDTTVHVGIGLVNAGARSYAGNGTSGAYVALPQIEVSSTIDAPSSLIINDSSAADVTRSADSLKWTDMRQVGLDATKGTFVVDFMLPTKWNGNIYHRVLEVSLDTNNRVEVTMNPTLSNKVGTAMRCGGVLNQVFATGSGTLNALTPYRVAMRYNSSELGISFMGQALTTTTNVGVPVFNEMRLGCSGFSTTAFGGWIGRVLYYPTDMLDLPSLSAI